MKYDKKVLCMAISCLLFTPQVYADASVGAYVNGDGWNVTSIDKFNTDTARNAAKINLFTTFNSNWDNLSQPASNIVSRAAIPIITWMPYEGAATSDSLLSDIATGQRDAYIDNWIDGFINWRNSYPSDARPSILMRFGHEFNGSWYPWGNKPEELKAAWQYLHQRFTDAGINDAVGWVWCANNVDVDDHSDISLYYPGDDYVDWLSLDGYNWGSNYSFTRWKSFDETFSQQYVKMVNLAPTKPIMLAEVGSAEPHDLPSGDWSQDGDDSDMSESKDAWIADMMQNIQINYPAIKSIVWFNTNKELSWGLNLAGNTGLSTYNNSITTNYFGGELPIKTTMTQVVEKTRKGRKDRGKPTPKNRSLSIANTKLTGLDNALSRIPEVVGQKLLEQEARGLRQMPEATLAEWRLKRLVD